VRVCPQCGTSLASPNQPPPTAGPPPTTSGYQPATPLAASQAPSIGTWALIGGGLAATLIIGLILVIGGGGDGGSDSEVFLVPATSVTADRFTDSFAVSPDTTVPAGALLSPSTVAGDTVGNLAVEGSTPGLYGGTRQGVECDPDKLVTSLAANPDKAETWAKAEGIEASAIASFVDGLTPVVLRRDTLVTDYGYRNGRATPRQAVLQAGTAVLVDAFGVPRTNIESGNPLAQPNGPTSQPRYRGTAWTGFAPSGVVRVSPAAEVEGLVLVDTKTNEVFTRPVGSVGAGDGNLATATCDLYPKDAACGAPSPATTVAPATAAATATPTAAPTPTAVPTPIGEPVELFGVNSNLGVQLGGPTVP